MYKKEHGIHPGTQFLQPRRGILQLNGGDGERHRVFLGEMFPKRSQNSGVVSQTPSSPISPLYTKQRGRRSLLVFWDYMTLRAFL